VILWIVDVAVQKRRKRRKSECMPRHDKKKTIRARIRRRRRWLKGKRRQ